MGKTSIEWTDRSINPIRARNLHTGAVGHHCEKISPGCDHCYASAFQCRFHMPAFPRHQKTVLDLAPVGCYDPVRVNDHVEVFLDESKLHEVLSRKSPAKFFWCDMTDVFGRWVPDSWLDRCFAVMALADRHTHQVLTKRAQRMRDYFAAPDLMERWTAASADLRRVYRPACGGFAPGFHPRFTPHIWVGVSVENQVQANARIYSLLQVPARVRYLSIEPLLGPIDLPFFCAKCGYSKRDSGIHMDHHLCGGTIPAAVDWVIVGGESGSDARPMHPEWARSLRDQCVAAGVPYFFKQWGQWAETGVSPAKPLREDRVITPSGQVIGAGYGMLGAVDPNWRDHHGAWMTRVGKKAAGRLLDGREWNEFPK